MLNTSEVTPNPTFSDKESILINTAHPWILGKNYFIRTVTHHYTGKLIVATEKELLLTNVAWIADDGRFHLAVKSGSFVEVEPFPKDKSVIINRSFVVDAVEIDFPLPEEVK